MESLKEIFEEMLNKEEQVTAQLAKDGNLYDGYPIELKNMHNKNADFFQTLLDNSEWPRISDVGEETAKMACAVFQHCAICRPSLMKKGFEVISELAKLGEAHKQCVAYVSDRISYYERRPQKFGTQFEWNQNNEYGPWKIENEKEINLRRKEMGLNTQEEHNANVSKHTPTDSAPSKTDYSDRENDFQKL
ncbi:MAG: hypothetical protein OEY38_24720, partial [Gammaproteobacteria bacterium]|nr:hypothetical protein [Gammaproteobacteria bacterium]